MKNLLKNTVTTVINTWQSQGKLPTDIEIPVQIERARDAKFGDFACNIAMLLSKICRRSPMDTAQEFVASLQATPQTSIATITVATPGFINFRMTEAAFHTVVQDILRKDTDYGHSALGQGQRVHMEFVSSNPTGPLHVGHGRHAAYGASLANILEMAGYEVYREYYVNDAGRQMRILALSVWIRYLELLGEPIAFPSRGYKGDYIKELAQTLQTAYGNRFLHPTTSVMEGMPPFNEAQEEIHADALAQRAENLLGKADFDLIFERALHTILQDMRDDLQEFGVSYQRWFHESELFHSGEITRAIQILRDGGFLYEAEDATWFRATDFGDKKDRVVIRSTGQPTYFASDVAYHLNKFERGFDHILDIYGSDHHGYVPRLKALVQALGKDLSKLEILLVQFAILYRGKTRASMSTRGGDFVTLRELRNEVGNDAARFFYILRKREQHLDFDLELAKSTSNENPVYYIQYAHARICSVFRQLAQKNWMWDEIQGIQHLSTLSTEHEKTLMRCLSRYPEVIELSAQMREPSTLAYYLQELANDFHAYYNASPFLVTEDALRDARLCLIAATRYVLADGLKLLGLSAPEMM